MPTQGKTRVWRQFLRMFSLPACVLKPFQKNASRRNILLLLAIQVIEVVGVLWLYYFHRNVALLSHVLPDADLVWGVPRWRCLFLLGLVGLFITLVGLAGAYTRRHTIMIPFFFLSPARLILIGALLQPPLSLACSCYHKTYVQCAALHSFQDKERKFDTNGQDAFDPDVPERYIQTQDFPKAMEYSPAESLIEQLSVKHLSHGNHKAMPKRALGHAILQPGPQEVGDGTKLEPAGTTGSNPPRTFVPGSVQQGWVHPPMAAAPPGMVSGASSLNGHQAAAMQNTSRTPGHVGMQLDSLVWPAMSGATQSIGSAKVPPNAQGLSSQVKGLDCTAILARVRSSLLEAPSQTKAADVAKPDLLTPQQQQMYQALYRRVQHVLELKKTAAATEEDLCRDLQNMEGTPGSPAAPVLATVAQDDERERLQQTPVGVPRPHYDDLQDVEVTKLRTSLFVAEACRCAYPSCMRTDEKGKDHWCFVQEDTIPDCKAKNIALFKDPDSGKPWTKDLCTAPCECMGTGMKPPVLEVPVPATLKERTDANPYFYGAQCEKWDNHDINSGGDHMEWCYVGLDTTCAWRDKSLVPHDLFAKWYYRSAVACKQKDMGVTDNCRVAKFYFLFMAIVGFVCFWALMLLLYFFIGNQCGDFLKAEQDFVAHDSDSEDGDADGNTGDKADGTKEKKNADESDSEEQDADEDEDARKGSERPPRNVQKWED